MYTDQKQIDAAYKRFDGFDIRFRNHEGEDPMQMLDLFNPDGTGCYHIRYVFDKRARTITISGDLGWAVFCPTWDADFAETAKVVAVGRNFGYFMEKCRATSDRYEYDMDRAKKEILEDFSNANVDDHAEDEDEKDSDETIEDAVSAVMEEWGQHGEGFCGFNRTDNREAVRYLKKYLGGDYCESLYEYGKMWSGRVYLWLAGLDYAFRTMKAEGKVA